MLCFVLIVLHPLAQVLYYNSNNYTVHIWGNIMNEQKWIILTGEEAGPKSNKMGGIWNVIDAEAVTMANLLDLGEIPEPENVRILVVGPYYGFSGADWNSGLDRVT